jgi:hypothetical protein
MFIGELIERHGIPQVSRLGGPALKLPFLSGSFAPILVIEAPPRTRSGAYVRYWSSASRSANPARIFRNGRAACVAPAIVGRQLILVAKKSPLFALAGSLRRRITPHQSHRRRSFSGLPEEIGFACSTKRDATDH